MKMHFAEREEAYGVVKAVAASKGSAVAERDLLKAEGIGASSRGLDDMGLDSEKWRLNTTQVTMVGHSFGAATIIEILRHADRFQLVGQGIMHDIWCIALNPPESGPKHHINAPLLGINPEAFIYWSDNFSATTRVCDEARRMDL